MVERREASNAFLRTPFLENYVERTLSSGSNDSQYDDVVVAVPDEFQHVYERSASGQSATGSLSQWRAQDEQLESKLDTPDLATQSRNTFQQIHELSRSRSSDRSRGRPYHSGHSIRNPIEKKSLVRRAAYSAKTDTWNFLYNAMIGLYMWPKWSWDAMKDNSKLTILSVKQGVCSGLASILCVVHFPQPFTQISAIALWAVVTTDLLYEGNIGLSISKGFNRVLGTLAAGFLGFGLIQIGPELGSLYPYFVVFCVMAGSAICRFLKGIPPLKDQWGYAFTVATIAFHIFIITAYLDPERWTLPMLRFSMILLGFAMSSIVNIAIQPIYAGDALHRLVAKNFDTAAIVFERCVEEYNKDTKLDHVPDILSGRSVDDKIHQSYHEIVMSDSDIDKLLSAVHWEPSHGKFFMGYPWHMYDDITDYLRYTLYDVIALDLCLRANIQAPKELRELFAEWSASNPSASKDIGSGNSSETNCNPNYSRNQNTEENIFTTDSSKGTSPAINIPAPEGNRYTHVGFEHKENMSKVGSPGRLPALGSPQKSSMRTRSGTLKKTTLETLSEGVPAINVSIPNSGSPGIATSPDQPFQEQDEVTTPGRGGTKRSTVAWQQTFSHRKSSLGPYLDGTLERISALSLVKFASLLIEVVSKMRYVVDCVEDLGEQARFENCGQAENKSSAQHMG
uniref:Aluminum-activated malate transporter n=1 Tax=Physcomitrium patens TaxID=3218 RepID=A0A7I4E3F8_PHYPA